MSELSALLKRLDRSGKIDFFINAHADGTGYEIRGFRWSGDSDRTHPDKLVFTGNMTTDLSVGDMLDFLDRLNEVAK